MEKKDLDGRVGCDKESVHRKHATAAIKARVKRQANMIPRVCKPATAERSYSDDELEYLRAVDVYKANRHVVFITVCEMLAIAKSLGYHK